MPFSEDRGRVVRITFDIVYPTGQLKTVAMNMSDSDWGSTAVIAFSEEGVEKYLQPQLSDALEKFRTQQEGAKFKPAMLVVDNDGKSEAMCGAHGSLSHAEADNPIGRFI